jgi:hypothetical protein
MRLAGTPLLAICLALALAACGGTESEPSSSTSASSGGNGPAASTKPRGDGSARQGGGSQQGGDGAAQEAPPVDAAGAGPEPGTRAVAPGVPVQTGGDNSVQRFGVEGGVDERERALATLRAYLQARVEGDWEAACAATSAEFKEQLATLVAISKSDEKPKGCAATLRLVLGSLPRSVMRRSAGVRELLSFRVEGGYAYVIFRVADGMVKFIAMADDQGAWKVNTTEPGDIPKSG